VALKTLLALVAAFALTAASAQGFQVGVWTQKGHADVWQARFVAAPWDRTDLTVQALDGGRTITFHDANGIAGKSTPTTTDGVWQPCTIVDQHTATCTAAVPLVVYAELADAPSRYRDLAPASGTPNPLEVVFGGAASDDIAIAHASSATVEDAGGANTIAVAAASQSAVTLFDGAGSHIDVKNGVVGDQVSCRLGLAARGPESLEGSVDDTVLAGHGIGDTVLADPGDSVDGCENDLPV
jgi:hypothetical protein